MIVTKKELLDHIWRHPGQTKSELVENFSRPGCESAWLHVSRLLDELMSEGRIARRRDTEHGQIYQMMSKEVAA